VDGLCVCLCWAAALRRCDEKSSDVERGTSPGPRAQHGTAGCRETPFCCDDVGRNQAFQAGASSAGAGAARRRMTCEPAQSPSPASSSGQHAVPSSRGMLAARSPPPAAPAVLIPRRRVLFSSHRRLRSANGTPSTCAPLAPRPAAPCRMAASPSHPPRCRALIGWRPDGERCCQCRLITQFRPLPREVCCIFHLSRWRPSFLSAGPGPRWPDTHRCHRARPAPSAPRTEAAVDLITAHCSLCC
jgi:hypothetical protein